MKQVKSYGILLHREVPKLGSAKRTLEVFLIKPNGPIFWENPKLQDIWGIPKGRSELHEAPLETAYREFYEETGIPAPQPVTYRELSTLVTRQGKHITIFTGDVTGKKIEWKGSNITEGVYPIGSGRTVKYAETVAGAWFPIGDALKKIGSGQKSFLNGLVQHRNHVAMQAMMNH